MTSKVVPIRRQAHRRWPEGTWVKLKDPELLPALMRANDIDSTTLARYCGVSRPLISYLVTGKRTSCSLKVAARIADVFRVPVETLFDVHVPSGSGARSRPVKRTVAAKPRRVA